MSFRDTVLFIVIRRCWVRRTVREAFQRPLELLQELLQTLCRFALAQPTAATPHWRLVWTNDEGDEGGAVTTVTFQEKGGQTLLVMHDLYLSKEALDGGSGSVDGMPETFEQLDELLVTLGASGGRS